MTRWNLQCNVADVLGLGPRTAGRLQQVGVRTAEQLLDADVQAVATRLDDPRFSAATLADWQREAELRVTIPSLPADAARVLAALGVGNVDTLSRMTPTELLTDLDNVSQTEPRLAWLAKGPRPSVGEVNSWIQCAQLPTLSRAA